MLDENNKLIEVLLHTITFEVSTWRLIPPRSWCLEHTLLTSVYIDINYPLLYKYSKHPKHICITDTMVTSNILLIGSCSSTMLLS